MADETRSQGAANVGGSQNAAADEALPQGAPVLATLKVIRGSSIGAVLGVPSDGIVLGRNPSFSGTLEDDHLVSRRHASINYSGAGQLVIEDLHSSNGTYVNDERISEPRIIHAGDQITVGGTTLECEDFAGAPELKSNEAPTDVGERWRYWVEKALGGTPNQVEAATQAAMAAIARGADQGEVANAAKAAWSGEDSLPVAGPAPQQEIQQPSQPARSETPVPESRGTGLSRTPPPGTIRGQIAGFQQRSEPSGNRYISVWDFRIDRSNESGAPLPPVAVEMRGFEFEGAIANGDEVEVIGRPRGEHVLHVRELENLTANSKVSVRKGPPLGVFRALRTSIKLVLLLVFLAVFAVVAVTILHNVGRGP